MKRISTETTSGEIAESVFSWILNNKQNTTNSFLCDVAQLQILVSDGYLTGIECRALMCYSFAISVVDEKFRERSCRVLDVLQIDPAFAKIAVDRLSDVLKNHIISSGNDLICNPPQQLIQLINVLLVEWEKSSEPRVLEGLDPIMFQHPEDRAALEVIKKIPGIDKVIGVAIDCAVREVELRYLSGAARVTRESMPSVWNAYKLAAKRLNYGEPLPELYIGHGPINAYAMGADRIFLFVSSRLLNLMNREELMFILGHELGHAMCRHAKYHSLCDILVKIGGGLLSSLTLGASKAITSATLKPLMDYWSRRSELSADRAGLLACQNREAALRAFMKMSGYPLVAFPEINTRSLISQGAAYERAMRLSRTDRTRNLLAHIDMSHPLIIARAHELSNWFNFGEYELLVSSEKAHMIKLRGLLDLDPQVYMLHCDHISQISKWSAEYFGMSRSIASIALRTMILEKKTPNGTPLSKIIFLESEICEKDGNIEYLVHVKVLKTQEAVETITLRLSGGLEWAEIPKQLRQEFIRNGGRDGRIKRKLYDICDVES